MDCPACKATGVVGHTATVMHKITLFAFIPFITSRSYTICCATCGQYFDSPQSPEKMAQMAQAQLADMLENWQVTNVDFLVKFCIIVSIVLGLAPILGLIFALIGVACTRKKRGRWKIAALVGLALSVISSVAFVVILNIGNHKS
jgi:hypothetical protein